METKTVTAIFPGIGEVQISKERAEQIKRLQRIIREHNEKIMNERERLGKRIAEMRKELGISQEKLAELSGVGYSHIARIELGRYSVGIDTLEKIGNVFGKKIDYIEKAP